MPFCDRPELVDYATNFTGMDPVKIGACPFAQDAGAGMGLAMFSMFVFGLIGIGLTVRTQHPAPIMIAGMLSIGVVAASVSGQAAQIAALVLVFGIAALGLYLYARAQRQLR